MDAAATAAERRMIVRLIDADALHDFVSEEFKDDVPYEWAWALTAVDRAPAVDAVPVSKLEELRDYLYAEDLIFMRRLAELNKLIANCGAKMDGVEEREK